MDVIAGKAKNAHDELAEDPARIKQEHPKRVAATKTGIAITNVLNIALGLGILATTAMLREQGSIR